MQQRAAAVAVAVGQRRAADEVGHPPRDLLGELVGGVVVPVAALAPLVLEHQRDRLGQAVDAEHGGEPVEVDEPVGDQPGVLEEPRLLDQVPDPAPPSARRSSST